MTFEVINTNKRVVFTTDYVSCIPNASDLKAMKDAGYKFRLDKKLRSIQQIKEYVVKQEQV